eukprot:908846-Pyramimonas_sp.AAC.1
MRYLCIPGELRGQVCTLGALLYGDLHSGGPVPVRFFPGGCAGALGARVGFCSTLGAVGGGVAQVLAA